MSEFYTVKQIDNSRLVRLVAPNQLRECAQVSFARRADRAGRFPLRLAAL